MTKNAKETEVSSKDVSEVETLRDDTEDLAADEDEYFDYEAHFDELDLGAVFKGRRLVGWGSDGNFEYEAWLSDAVRKIQDLLDRASNADVNLGFKESEDVIIHCGVDYDTTFYESECSSSWCYWYWVDECDIAAVKTKLDKWIEEAEWTWGCAYYDVTRETVFAKIDRLQCEINALQSGSVASERKLREQHTETGNWQYKFETQDTAFRRNLRLLFDVLGHQVLKHEKAIVLGPIAYYNGVFALVKKEGDVILDSLLSLSLWNLIKSVDGFKTIEIEKRTEVLPEHHPDDAPTIEPQKPCDWDEVWIQAKDRRRIFHVESVAPKDRAALVRLVEEGIGAAIRFTDWEKNDEK